MNIQVVNEILQWIAVLAVLMLTLAVYRRLGIMMLMGEPEYLADSFGPDIGNKVDDQLFSVFSGLGYWKLLLFLSESCPACLDALSQVKHWVSERTANFELAVLVEGDNEFTTKVAADLTGTSVRAINQVLTDDQKPGIYPFAMLLSNGGVVEAKRFGSDLSPFLKKMLEESKGKEK